MEVPETLSPLSESGEQRFLDAILELVEEQDSVYGLHNFHAAKSLLSSFMPESNSSTDSD